MSEENNWYERLLNEKSSLDEKIRKLIYFLDGDKINKINPDPLLLILIFSLCYSFCSCNS
jgi:hypothetical protein